MLRLLPGGDAIADYAVKQWEGVLTFLLDPTKQPPSLPVGLVRARPAPPLLSLRTSRLFLEQSTARCEGRTHLDPPTHPLHPPPRRSATTRWTWRASSRRRACCPAAASAARASASS